MTALATALEISAIASFIETNSFKDIDPKINKNKADISIKPFERNLIVEVTAICKDLVDRSWRVGVISVDKMEYQIISKLKEEQKQLPNNEPSLLIISLPPLIGADQETAKWALSENLKNYSNISAVLIADSYKFKYGSCYFNDHSHFPLMDSEKNYVSGLLKPTTNPLS